MQESNKAELRNLFRDKRQNMDSRERDEASARIRARLLDQTEVWKARSILLYVATKNEVDTWPLMEHFWAKGRQVLLPRCRDNQPGFMDIHAVRAPRELGPGQFGLTEPVLGVAPLIPDPWPDVVLIPALAFDRHGFRLGFGGGYYDRFLSRLTCVPLLIGLAYDFQLLDALPSEAWDIPVHRIVTPDTTIITEKKA